MPTISRFFGVTIRMYFDEHGAPHFHAVYAEWEAVLTIDTLERIEGSLPGRVLGLVLEWASQHREELRHNWELARRHEPLQPIAPLE